MTNNSILPWPSLITFSMWTNTKPSRLGKRYLSRRKEEDRRREDPWCGCNVGVQRGVRHSALPLGRKVQRQTRRGVRAWSWAWRREGWPVHWKHGGGGRQDRVTRHLGPVCSKTLGFSFPLALPPTRCQCFTLQLPVSLCLEDDKQHPLR